MSKDPKIVFQEHLFHFAREIIPRIGFQAMKTLKRLGAKLSQQIVHGYLVFDEKIRFARQLPNHKPASSGAGHFVCSHFKPSRWHPVERPAEPRPGPAAEL